MDVLCFFFTYLILYQICVVCGICFCSTKHLPRVAVGLFRSACHETDMGFSCVSFSRDVRRGVFVKVLDVIYV